EDVVQARLDDLETAQLEPLRGLDEQELRVAAVLELHFEVLAEVGHLRDAGQRLDERAVALEGERHGVLAVASLHLRDGAVEDLLAAIDERDAVAEPLD